MFYKQQHAVMLMTDWPANFPGTTLQHFLSDFTLAT